MFRIKLLLIGLGLFLAYFGLQEIKVSKGTTTKPAELDLALIEAGTADTKNAHIKLGSHWPAYFELIYYGEEKTNKVEYVYYPVLSENHPFILKLAELYERYPEGNIPEEERPEVGEFSVLVKSKRYSTLEVIPDNFDIAKSVQGLVVNKIEKLKKDELDLLRKSFPGLNPDKILLLEEGRKPAGAGKKFGALGGGILLSLVGAGWFIIGFKRR